MAKKVKAMRLSEFGLSHPRGNEFSLVSLNVMVDVGIEFGHRMHDVPIKVSRDNRNIIHRSKLARG